MPREFATGAETTDIAYEAELLAGSDLMPDPRPYYWIDPFKVARPSSGKSTVSVPVRRSDTSTSWFQYRALPIRSNAVKLPGALSQRATS